MKQPNPTFFFIRLFFSIIPIADGSDARNSTQSAVAIMNLEYTDQRKNWDGTYSALNRAPFGGVVGLGVV
ncbi:hypothetical protein BJV78DRAFT_1221609 [Lactifluus subvellereus]|nr:hypothetical protein BJV78DRAFT_1221609 [Lactifluus subvellereus]